MAEALHSQHTTTFPDLLSQAKASLVVSTYQAGKLILLRANDKALNTHFVSLAKPMGVAYSNGRLSVGSGAQVIDYYNMSDVGPKVEPMNTHDGAFLPRRTHVTGNIDIHEMAFDQSEELWIVNTKMSCLCTLDKNHSIVPRWRPPFISGYDLSDRCHLNGLAMRDGEPRYVSALGTTDTPAGWRENKAFGGMIMDLKDNRMITNELSMPHSPRWYRNKLWVLESGAGQLITLDEKTGEKTVIAQVPGFCRGIDFIERYALIGLSEVRETAVFAGLPLTEREQDRKCGVWIVDIESGETVGYLVFSGGVQEIFSVQLVPWKYPALLDQNDPLLQTSYSIPDEAIKDFTPPDPTQLVFEKAIQHHRLKEFDDAISTYKEFIQKDPSNVNALYHLGVAYSDTERWDEAISILNSAVSLNKNHAEAYNLLGQAHACLFEFDKALTNYESAIAADQKYALAHYNRSTVLLKLGNFKQGWSEYAWRLKLPNFTPFHCPQPMWLGEDISNKTIMVHTEYDSGDAIQFARFLPALKARCRKLVVVCPEPLRLLFKAMDCVNEVRLPSNTPNDLFDVYIPIMSLAGLLDIDASNLYVQSPYLKTASEVVVPTLSSASSLSDNSSTKKSKKKVALVWSSDTTHAINRHHSCTFEEMVTLCSTRNQKYFEFYSFQAPLSEEHRKLLAKNNIHNLEQETISYAHTGALLQQMDVVVGVGNSMMKLAGALSLNSIVLLSQHADWRWHTDETESSWYPSIDLLRLSKNQTWLELVEECSEKLDQLR